MACAVFLKPYETFQLFKIHSFQGHTSPEFWHKILIIIQTYSSEKVKLKMPPPNSLQTQVQTASRSILSPFVPFFNYSYNFFFSQLTVCISQLCEVFNFFFSWIRKFGYPCSEGRAARPSLPGYMIPSPIYCLIQY